MLHIRFTVLFNAAKTVKIAENERKKAKILLPFGEE